jgi:hypothetical protein
MTNANALEDSYLRHILIAAAVRDHSAPFRTFFDNWFAFKEGGPFLNGNSRPHWFNNPCADKHGEALRRAHFVSQSAARTLGGLDGRRLMKDHAVPVAVLRDILFEEQPNSVEEVRAFLLEHYCFGIITEDEDRKLNAAGLRSRMPEGWTTADQPFARYEKVGIVGQVGSYGAGSAGPRSAAPEFVKRTLNHFAGLLSSTTSDPCSKGRANG